MKAKYRLNLTSVLLMLLMVTFTTSCSKDDDLSNEIELIVASEKVMSEGGIQKECNIVKEEGGEWQILFSLMPDFQYEEGYEYRLKVRKIVPSPDIMDAYTSYELISQISKEKTTTVFKKWNNAVSNNAHAEGSGLSATEIAEIENKIKAASPFSGVSDLTFNQTNFPLNAEDNREGFYTLGNGKSGNFSIELKETENKPSFIYTFDFDGNKIAYEYQSATSIWQPYLILDVTAAYKVDYPALDVALSRIGLKPTL